MPPRSEDPRKAIREVGRHCFVRQGYAGTHLSDIARAAGLSKGGLYFHYPSKHELFADILRTQVEALRARWGFDPNLEVPASQLLARLVVAQLRSWQDDRDELGLLNELVVLADRDPLARETLSELVDLLSALYRRVIERGVESGEFRAGDPSELARSVLAFVHGLAALLGSDEWRELDVEGVALRAVAMLR